MGFDVFQELLARFPPKPINNAIGGTQDSLRVAKQYVVALRQTETAFVTACRALDEARNALRGRLDAELAEGYSLVGRLTMMCDEERAGAAAVAAAVSATNVVEK